MRKRAFVLCLLGSGQLAAQTPGVQPEPGSVTDGVPPIPPQLVSDLGRYTRYRNSRCVNS